MQINFSTDRTEREIVYEFTWAIYRSLCLVETSKEQGEEHAKLVDKLGAFCFPESDLMYPWRSHNLAVSASLKAAEAVFYFLSGVVPNYADKCEFIGFGYLSDCTQREFIYGFAEIIHEAIAIIVAREKHGYAIATAIYESIGFKFNFPENDLMCLWRSQDSKKVAALKAAENIFEFLTGNQPSYSDVPEEG